MKLGNKGNNESDGLGEWRTDLSWYEDGTIHPITAKVFYAVPNFEVVDVSLDYNTKLVEIPSRMVSMIIATAIDEYLQAAPTMRRTFEEGKAKKKKTNLIDPLFED